MGELQKIRDRLTTLETKFKERWDAHDKQSTLIWKTINGKLDSLLKHKDAQPDKQEDRKESCMKESKGYSRQLVAWVLGVPGALLTILGIIWGVKRLFLVVFLCFLLTGCAITTEFYHDGKLIGHIKQTAKGAASVKKDDIEMLVDSRSPTVWERFITPIFKGASDSAKSNVNMN